MNKTRHLSLIDYLEILQKEYFICEMRSRFYYNPNDKRYWKKVSEHKKAKIVKIGEENKISNIFNNQAMHDKIKQSLYPINGMPQFEMTKKDIEHYYSEGSDVKCLIDDNTVVIGKIEKNLPKSQKISVKLRHSEQETFVSYTHASRII